MRALCNNHSFIRELGLNFVQMVSKLMKILLEYRAISLQDSKENQVSKNFIQVENVPKGVKLLHHCS